ncbi:MAG TPA: hypothetical protein VHQ03_09335, partial [Candidatus Dormibacteraeota bacterium]|nr:hypothetical protein [Candidatus Dormibacteraeota bacterium]
SVRVLSTQEAVPYRPEPGEVLAANFWSVDRWHIARIPAAPVADVIVHVEQVAHSFPGAHAQIRFRLLPGREVTLLPQPPDVERDSTRIADLLYTVEGNFPPGTSSNPRGGFQQSGIAYMLMSLKDKVEIMKVDGVLPRVHQYRLQIEPNARHDVLRRALDIATRSESHKMFNLLRRNCTTEAIRVLDGALHYPTWRRLLARVTYDGLPEAMHMYLGERGLLGPDSRMPDLADDPSWS